MKSYTFTPYWQFPTTEISVFMEYTAHPTLVPHGWKLAAAFKEEDGAILPSTSPSSTDHCWLVYFFVDVVAWVGRHLLPLFFVFIPYTSCFSLPFLAQNALKSTTSHVRSQLSHLGIFLPSC